MKSINGCEFAELGKNSIFEEKISQNHYFNSDLINEDDAIIIENETTDNCLDTTKKESNKSKLKIEEKDNVNKPFDVETNNIQCFNQAHNFFEL